MTVSTSVRVGAAVAAANKVAGDLLKDLLLGPSASAMAQLADIERALDTEMTPADQAAEQAAEKQPDTPAGAPAEPVADAEPAAAVEVSAEADTAHTAPPEITAGAEAATAQPPAKDGAAEADRTWLLLEAAGLADGPTTKDAPAVEATAPPEAQGNSTAVAQPAQAAGGILLCNLLSLKHVATCACWCAQRLTHGTLVVAVPLSFVNATTWWTPLLSHTCIALLQQRQRSGRPSRTPQRRRRRAAGSSG